MDLSRQDDKGRNRLARRVDSLDYYYPLPIAWLYDSCSSNCIRACDYFRCRSHAHHESRLIKGIGIIVKYAVRLTRILNALEPRVNRVWILAFRAL